MGNNVPPERIAYRMGLQTADFFRALRNELVTSTNHIQIIRGEIIGLYCIPEHVRRANDNMIVPFRPNILERVMTHFYEFVCAVVRRPNNNRLICVELGILLERLITGRVHAHTHPIETISEE
ncbi:hypothetical protein FRX31_034074 [Thalictrum thalictroides]|uniref:Uncharacterized protein n=1 Tax=Thalictrum thalictroides TaxID=46969 RepID=A0A7J6UUU8_THATH|nr:hypothetical protein FRX31_034074 [Thalictrum thalictroides]